MERRIINPWSWQERFGFNQGHEVAGAERTLYLAGQVSLDAEGRLLHEGDVAAQIDQCLDNIETVLGAAGMTLANVVRLTTYTTDLAAFAEHRSASLDRLRSAGSRHVSTLLGVAGLALPELLVEMEATAVA